MRDSAQRFSPVHGTEAPAKLGYKVPEAADQLGISDRLMWQLIESGEIASYQIGRARRISHQALVEFIERKTTPAKAA